MRSLHLLCAALLAAVSGTVAAAAPERLALGVVPSLGPAATALQIEFGKTHPEVVVTIGVASTPALVKAARADGGAALLLLDGRAGADTLVTEAGAPGDSVTVFGSGLLALYSNTPGVNTQRGAPLFIADYITGIALANPVGSPFGQLARDAMDRLTLLETATPKFRQYPDDGAAAAAVLAREVDLGVLPVPLLVQPAYQKTGSTTALPLGLYTPAAYTAVITAAGRDSTAAKAWLAFLKADSTRPLLTELGIAPPPSAP
jgi:molybdate transport system substrate-binding protein